MTNDFIKIDITKNGPLRLLTEEKYCGKNILLNIMVGNTVVPAANTIKAGTYRFNDVIETDGSTTLYQDIDFEYTQSVALDEITAAEFNAWLAQSGITGDIQPGTYTCSVQGNSLRVDSNKISYLETIDIQNLTPYNPNLLLIFSMMSGNANNIQFNYIYPYYKDSGWNKKDYMNKPVEESAYQTITISKDTKVSEEFSNWFAKNTQKINDLESAVEDELANYNKPIYAYHVITGDNITNVLMFTVDSELTGYNVVKSYGEVNSITQDGETILNGWQSEEERMKFTRVFIKDVIFPEDGSMLFGGLVNVDWICGLSKLRTDKMTTMTLMFTNCKHLQTLDLSNFNTEKVTSMGGMFWGCEALTELDVSNFDTSNVSYMGEMFATCQSLTSLDLSNFNTSKVTYMSGMFNSCTALEFIEGISDWDVSNVTDMRVMFDDCKPSVIPSWYVNE